MGAAAAAWCGTDALMAVLMRLWGDDIENVSEAAAGAAVAAVVVAGAAVLLGAAVGAACAAASGL